jgi:hypothetical protein
MSESKDINKIKTVSQYHQLCGLQRPSHPLISVTRLEETDFY